MLFRIARTSLLGRRIVGCRKLSTADKVKDEGKRDYLGIALFSGICVTAAALGTWQVKRYFWKVELIETIKNTAADPPATLPASTNQRELHNKFEAMKGQRVLLTGRFDHSKEVFLGLRSAPTGFTGGAAQGMAVNPQGYYLITPMVLDDGTVVHVNRGWVPRTYVVQEQQQQQQQQQLSTAGTSQAQPLWSRPQGRVSIAAVVSEGEKAGTFSPASHPGAHTLLWLDPSALLQRTQTPGPGASASDGSDALVIAEALGDYEGGSSSGSGSNNSGKELPYAKSLAQLQEQSVAPATHFVYALTWFSLAAAGFYMTYLKFRRGGVAGIQGVAASVGGKGGAQKAAGKRPQQPPV